MKIKYIVLITIGFLFCNNTYSQNIIEQLKQFYKNADMDCYIDKIQNNVNDFFVLENKIWGRDKYGISPQKIELKKDEIVPMLTIQFVNTDTFNLSDDIYNYITIDSVIVFTIACIDKKKNVKAFANFFDGINGYFEVDKCPFKSIFKRIIKKIYKQKPELILYSHVLCGFHDNNGFMFIKKGKIYVYRVEDIQKGNKVTRRTGSVPENEKIICP